MSVHVNEQPYCLVLGGGGAKGVYHIGVWQALKEMNIPVNAFIGNSIGAIVAAFLAQGAEAQLLNIARSMTINSLIRLNKDIALADSDKVRGQSLSYWQGVYKNVVENKGLDTTPMRSALEEQLDEKSLRAANFDFGITTVNLSDFKPREVFIEDMEPGQIINYIMASAAFPGFSNPKIKGKKYIDGGLYDNIPFNMAKRRGYRKIILVDVSGIGLHRRPKTDGTQTVHIKNSIDMGNAFDFDPDFIDSFIKLGYLDTMRTFGKLIGYQYFIEQDDHAEDQWQSERDRFTELSSIYPSTMKHDRRIGLKTLEVCAELLDIGRIEKFSYSSLQSAINKELQKTRKNVETTMSTLELDAKSSSKKKVIDSFLKAAFNSEQWDHNPYYYLLLLKSFDSNAAVKLAETTLRKWSPELAVLEAYVRYSKEQ